MNENIKKPLRDQLYDELVGHEILDVHTTDTTVSIFYKDETFIEFNLEKGTLKAPVKLIGCQCKWPM